MPALQRRASDATRIDQAARAWAARTPDAPALSAGGRHWRYADLAAAADAAAAFLAAQGVRRGDRVMLIGENGLAMAALIYGTARLDACAVLENARRAPNEVDLIRAHCDPRLVVYATGESPDALAHAARHGATPHEPPLLGPLACGATAAGSTPDPVTGTDQDTAVLIYTTGTTGTPKGVMLMHANLLYLAEMMGRLRKLTPADRVYGVLPMTHVMGLAGMFGGTLAAGAHVHLVARFSPADCLAALAAEHITILQGAPAMFAKLAHHARAHGLHRPGDPPMRSALRFIAMGGAPIDATVKADTEALFGLPLHNGYGLTEGSGLTWTRLDAPRTDCSVGQALPGVELRILDADSRPVGTGQVGELWARGPNVMKGYYRNPALTAQAMAEGGWFNTQDLARQDADGQVFIEGRTKDLIISAGFNVYPLEVENALHEHPAIVVSAVVGRTVEGNEEIVAFVELGANAELTLAGLQSFLATRISPYKRPREVWVLPALPTSPNGKVLKNQLKTLAAAGPGDDARRLR